MRIPIMNLETVGIIPDISPVDLPLNAWSSGRNVRFEDGKILPATGFRKVFKPSEDVTHLVEQKSGIGPYWYMGSRHKLTARTTIIGETATDYSRTPPAGWNVSYNYNQYAEFSWQSTVFNGVLIMNNRLDPPQRWEENSLFTNLPGWGNPSGGGTTLTCCESIRGYKNYLVAAGVGTPGYSGVQVPISQRVLWSHFADPGTVPSSWDIADPTKDAGDFLLAETPGPIIDQLELRGLNIIYKTDAVHAMRHVGGIDIMGQQRLAQGAGLLTQNAVAKFRGTQGDLHIAWGPSEVYVTEGVSFVTPFRKRLQRWIYKQLTATNKDNVWLVNNSAKNEIWVGVPEGGALYPTVAVVWNYLDDTITFRDLPGGAGGTSAAGVGRMGWDERRYGAGQPGILDSELPGHPTLMLATIGANRYVYAADRESTFAGAAIPSVIERRGLAVVGQDRSGKPIYDTEQVKILTEVWPRVEGVIGDVMSIYVGAQDSQQKPIRWQGPYPFRIGIDDKVNPVISGKLLSVRFEISSFNEWKFNGYDLEIKPGGAY